MKKFLLITTIVIMMALSDGMSQNRTIRFVDKPWSEILAMAKNENKLIFMDGFATWCGPCKWMASNIFTNDTVADFYNKTFICSSFDMEKGEGMTLRQKYDIRAYPSLLFINSDGELVHKKVGAAQKIQDYINFGLTAMNPDECLAAYNKKYAAGNMDPKFIEKYLRRLGDAYITPTDLLKKYFSTQKEEDLFSRANWNIICNYVTDVDSREFQNLVKHEKDYGKLYTHDSVNDKISDTYVAALGQATRYANMTDAAYNALKEKVKASGFSSADKVIFTSDLNLYYTRSDKEKYLDLAYGNLDKFYAEDYNMLNNIAWNVSQLCAAYDVAKAKKYLEKAQGWSRRSVTLKSEPGNNNTLAMILFRLGKKKEAIHQERIAIALAKKIGMSTRQFDASLKQMLEPEGDKKH
ncbi:MAG: thioredoxin domain-containing protein [Bacteroidetes bacterium]|nr:thioredoxin domain-containing protein [Bacteroidota bacterium]